MLKAKALILKYRVGASKLNTQLGELFWQLLLGPINLADIQ